MSQSSPKLQDKKHSVPILKRLKFSKKITKACLLVSGDEKKNTLKKWKYSINSGVVYRKNNANGHGSLSFGVADLVQ